MSELRCAVVDKDNNRCETAIQVLEPVSEGVRFICKNHPESVQRKTAGNVRLPRPEVHFQEFQFDPDLRRGAKPDETGHIIDPKTRVNPGPPSRAFVDGYREQLEHD
jgi:hypothetical protein